MAGILSQNPGQSIINKMSSEQNTCVCYYMTLFLFL